MADFTVQHEGSIVLLKPWTDAARQWVDNNIGADSGYQPYWPTVVVEPRYLRDIYKGIQADALSIMLE